VVVLDDLFSGPLHMSIVSRVVAVCGFVCSPAFDVAVMCCELWVLVVKLVACAKSRGRVVLVGLCGVLWMRVGVVADPGVRVGRCCWRCCLAGVAPSRFLCQIEVCGMSFMIPSAEHVRGRVQRMRRQPRAHASGPAIIGKVVATLSPGLRGSPRIRGSVCMCPSYIGTAAGLPAVMLSHGLIKIAMKANRHSCNQGPRNMAAASGSRQRNVARLFPAVAGLDGSAGRTSCVRAM